MEVARKYFGQAIKLNSNNMRALFGYYLVCTSSLYPFNSLFSRTAWVSQHQKCRTILDFNEARDDGWQWRQLDHMQIICTSLQTDNHASIPSLNFYRLDALPDTQPTVLNHWYVHADTKWLMDFKMLILCSHDDTIPYQYFMYNFLYYSKFIIIIRKTFLNQGSRSDWPYYHACNLQFLKLSVLTAIVGWQGGQPMGVWKTPFHQSLQVIFWKM